MIFCGITLLPGERKNVPLPVPDAPSLNALCLCGAAPGKTLVVTAGVHGCEYVGIQVWRRTWIRRGCRGTSSYCRWQIPVLFMPEPNRWCRRTASI